MEKYKIGFLLNKYPGGGVETVIRHVSNYLKSKGHDIYIFVGELDEKLLLEDHLDNITYIKYKGFGVNSDESLKDIIEKVNDLQLDFLNVPAIFNFDFAILRKGIKTTKLIVSDHGMPMGQNIVQFNSKQERAKKGKSISRKICWYTFRYLKYKFLKKISLINNYRRTYSLCDGYTVLCDKYKDTFLNILNIKNSIEDNHLFVLNNPSIPPEKIVLDKQKEIIFVGRIATEKRVNLIVDAWAMIHDKFPDWKLTIVGDGGDMIDIKKQIDKHNLKNIEFPGFIADPQKYYDRASILCLSSLIEGWPMVLGEAQMNGVIPVAFGCSDGVKEIVSPSGVNGILVENNNVKAMADSLSKLMSDDNKRKEIQQNVLKVNEKYSIEKIGKQWEEMFNRLSSN